MHIVRLPESLIRFEHGLVKDHVVILDDDSHTPLAWPVDATFAGYLAGMMAELIAEPAAVHSLERRLSDDALLPESRQLFRDMVRTARRRSESSLSQSGKGR